MKNLNGHVIKRVTRIKEDLKSEEEEMYDYDHDNVVDHDIIELILKEMNARTIVKMFHTYGFVKDNGEPEGLIKDTLFGLGDITSNAYFMRAYWRAQTYPFKFDNLVIISLKTYVSYSEKLGLLFGQYQLTLLIIIFLIFIYILRLILKLSVSAAILDFLRIFLNVPVPKTPNVSSLRIFFIIVSYTLFIINALTQSRLTAINSIRKTKPTIDSVKELIESNISIYGEPGYRNLTGYDEIRLRYHDVFSVNDCLKLLWEGIHVACLHPSEYLKPKIHDHPSMHVSRNLLERNSAYICSPDSPLIIG